MLRITRCHESRDHLKVLSGLLFRPFGRSCRYRLKTKSRNDPRMTIRTPLSCTLVRTARLQEDRLDLGAIVRVIEAGRGLCGRSGAVCQHDCDCYQQPKTPENSTTRTCRRAHTSLPPRSPRIVGTDEFTKLVRSVPCGIA
jgi:hypothetical protein